MQEAAARECCWRCLAVWWGRRSHSLHRRLCCYLLSWKIVPGAGWHSLLSSMCMCLFMLRLLRWQMPFPISGKCAALHTHGNWSGRWKGPRHCFGGHAAGSGGSSRPPAPPRPAPHAIDSSPPAIAPARCALQSPERCKPSAALGCAGAVLGAAASGARLCARRATPRAPPEGQPCALPPHLPRGLGSRLGGLGRLGKKLFGAREVL